MKKEFIVTEDGSHTILLPELNTSYHSTHGAIQESNHVYIKSGLDFVAECNIPSVNIFEMGFGTGLNALLSCIRADKLNIPVQYTAIDLYPLSTDETDSLNYPLLLENNHHYFHKIHTAEWEKKNEITDLFQLTKNHISFADYDTPTKFNLIYFDAFDPSVQPELWTAETLFKLYNMLCINGVIVTYSSKSEVRKNMVKAGFLIEKLKGPPGKREIVRAIKCK